MPEVRGKFIELAGTLMTLYPGARQEADAVLEQRTGRHWDELDPDEWFDADIFAVFLDTYCGSSAAGDDALITLGKRIFPTKRKLGELPDEIGGALELLKFSTRSFTDDHRGPGIRPIRIVRAEEGDVVVDVPYPGYDCRVSNGVYLGILGMFGIKGGKVEQARCVSRGDRSCEFHITW
jgi:hypothetical protein